MSNVKPKFSELDQAKLNLIRLKAEWEKLMERTMLDPEHIGHVEKQIAALEEKIKRLEKTNA